MSGGNREVSLERVLVPQAPVLVAGFREVLWLSPDGEVEALAPPEARSRVERETPMLCHARATARRLDLPIFPALDLLELFAFVRPARFCVPTPRGLAAALGLDLPRRPAEACVTLATAAHALLQELGADTDAETRAVAEAMERGGWLWAPAVIAALPAGDPNAPARAAGLRAWTRLAEKERTIARTCQDLKRCAACMDFLLPRPPSSLPEPADYLPNQRIPFPSRGRKLDRPRRSGPANGGVRGAR